MFIFVFSRIGVIFILLLLGMIAKWRRVLSEEAIDGLSRLAIEVTLPFLYFYTLSTRLSRDLFFSIIALPFLAMLLIFISYFLSWLISSSLKLTSIQRRSFIFSATFPNYGFFAIPLVFALFGEEGLVRVFMFNLGITVLYWTMGVSILRASQPKKSTILRNLANNATLALVLGLTVGISSFTLPGFMLEAFKLIGNATIPLALILVGAILAQSNPRKVISFKVISTLVFCRLILMPSLAILLVNIFAGLPKIIAVLIVLQAAMPSASTSPMLTRRFGGDSELAASAVFFTTLLSIITVPIFVSLALR